MDRIFINSFLADPKSPIHIVPESFQIVAPDFAKEEWTEDDGTKIMIPRRYDFGAKKASDTLGLGDHFGLVVDLEVEGDE